MKRSPMPRSTTPLVRRQRLRPESAKRRRERPARQAVRLVTLERAGWCCQGRDLVPEVECWGELQVDERVSRGVRPGAHLEDALTQALCVAHHYWRTVEPAEARRRGLRLESWEVAS